MKTLGIITTYHGTEHRYLHGHQVRIIAVFKNAARADYDPDAADGYLNDDDAIARCGGVTADDRVEVQPWLEKEGRFSFASSDPKAIDLEAFAHLAR
jgi:hypothetical protein